MPTVSLIMDQFRWLEAAGVKVTYIGSMQKASGVWGRCHRASTILLCAHVLQGVTRPVQYYFACT